MSQRKRENYFKKEKIDKLMMFEFSHGALDIKWFKFGNTKHVEKVIKKIEKIKDDLVDPTEKSSLSNNEHQSGNNSI